MEAGGAPGVPQQDRLSGLWDELKASFGMPAGLAMLAGLVLGFALPTLDDLLDVDIPTFSFAGPDAATGLLETIATVTVSVAGLAFSVTIVAFTLTSSQLSPRVLRTFRSDRLSQAVLATFLGTFIYCLAVLVRLGAREEGAVPNLAITLALLLALVSFVMFALFVGHIARMLQPSTVIARIVEEAKGALGARFPSAIGTAPEHVEAAHAEARTRMERSDPLSVEADDEGYLSVVQGERLMTLARNHGGLVRQRVAIGDYATPAVVLAEVWVDDLPEDDRDALTRTVRGAFVLAQQRTLAEDVAFPVRQLADIALKGLSPGINDPTTAENAMEAMTSVIVRFVRSDHPSDVRVDSEGQPRFVAQVPQLDDVVRLGFEQTRVFAAPYPVVSVNLLALLERIAKAARDAGVEHLEVTRQATLLRQGPEGEVPTEADVERVHRAHTRMHTPHIP